LLASLGHRRNLLSPAFTHVGLGAVATSAGKSRQWLFTQAFAKPVAPLEAAAEAARILSLIQERRRSSGVMEMTLDPALERIANGAAARAKEDGRRVVDEAARAVRARGGAWAWLVATSDLSKLRLPEEVALPRWQRVGIGLAQEPDDPRGLVRLVLVLAAAR
jgi:uncharacterized protein YkwD